GRGCVGGDGSAEVGHVAPYPLLLGGVPPDQLLPLAPRLPRRVGRGPVVEDPPVGRPGESPPMAEVVLGLGLLPAQGQVLPVLGIDAGVDPVPAGGGAVVLEVAERLDQLPLLVEELARLVLVRDVVGRAAVAFL